MDDVELRVGSCPEAEVCSAGEIACGETCLSADKRCDRTADCFDLSDEEGCDWTLDCDFSTECPGYSIGLSVDYRWTYDLTGKCIIS